jgi:transcriptional regulator with XRE-family HTH domain
MSTILTDLGSRIRSLRATKGISQEELAVQSGLDRTYISRVERGIQNVSTLNLDKIAVSLNVTIRDLF